MYYFTCVVLITDVGLCVVFLAPTLQSLVNDFYAVFGVARGADKDYLVLNEKCKIFLSQRSSGKMGGSKFWW